MSSFDLDRRRFLGFGAAAVGGAAVSSAAVSSAPLAAARLPRWLAPRPANLFPISLAQWSLHRALQKGELNNLEFPQKARSFDIDAIEYVNSFWKDKARNADYLKQLKQRCDDAGVQSVLIMCDGEGALGDPIEKARLQAVENHHQWIEAAKQLGCHAIRVNAQSSGSWEEQQKLAADGLRKLCEYGDQHGIDVIVENHGGLSSNGKWLAGTLKMVDHKRAGALPDFGNFRVSKDEQYDRYLGVGELMPFARGVSAKSHDFDEHGEELHTDYHKMLAIVCVEHGWRRHIGIEYEGGKLSEPEGITKTRDLLIRVRDELTAKLDAAKPQATGADK